MNTIVTKETWSSDPDNAPLSSDFNRIESNTRKVEENRQEETTARENADTTLQNNIDSEETARIAADSAILATFVSGSGGVFHRFDLAPSSAWVIPAGLYMLVGVLQLANLELRDPILNVWLIGGNPGGLVISDGTNYRITTSPSVGATIAYWKFR